MRLDAFLWSVIIFVMVTLTGSFIMIDSVQHYGIDYDNATFGEVYNLSDDLYDLSTDQKEDVIGGDIDQEDASDAGIQGASRAFKLLRRSPRHVGNIMDDIANKIGIDEMYIDFFKIGLLISIIFAIAYLFFRIRAF